MSNPTAGRSGQSGTEPELRDRSPEHRTEQKSTATDQSLSLGTQAIALTRRHNASNPRPIGEQPAAKFVDTLVGDRYDVALSRFLRQGTYNEYLRQDPPKRYNRLRPNGTIMTVIDHMDHYFQSDEQVIPLEGEVSDSFKKILNDVPLGSKGRFLLWHLGGLLSINPNYLDYVALKYDLSPHFLTSHLAVGYRASPTGSHFHHATSTEKNYLHIQEDKETALTVTCTEYSGRFLVVALGQDNYKPATYILDRFLQNLEPQSSYMTRLVTQPMDFVIPYLGDLFCRIAGDIGNYAFTQSRDDGSPYDLIEQESNLRLSWGYLRNWGVNLQIIKQSLLRYQQCAHPMHRLTEARLHEALEELDMLIEDLHLQASYQQDLIQMAVSDTSSQQTRRSLAETASTRRLAIIACIFLPLNFATSFLGMNLQQLNGGSLGMSWFFFIALLAGGLSVFILFVNPSIESSWSIARVDAAHDEGYYDERDYDRIPTHLVARTYVKSIHHKWKLWWRFNIQRRLRRTQPRQHAA